MDENITLVSKGKRVRTSWESLGYWVEHGAPRPLTAIGELTILVFTKGAFGEETVIDFIDGVLLGHNGITLSCFCGRVPDLLMGLVLEEAENPIYLVELLAVYEAAFL